MSIQTYTDPWPHSKVVPIHSFQTRKRSHVAGNQTLMAPTLFSGKPAAVNPIRTSSSSQLCLSGSLSALLPSSVPSVRAGRTAGSQSQRPPPSQNTHDFKGRCLWAFHWVSGQQLHCFWLRLTALINSLVCYLSSSKQQTKLITS